MNSQRIDESRRLNRRWALVLLGAGAFTSSVAVATPASALSWYAGRVDGTRHVESDADEILPAASVIKLLIVMALVDEAHLGRFSLTTRVALAANDRVAGSDRFRRAAPGRYPAGALLDAMLSLSDNTASNALLRAAGMPRCNEVAAAHGLPSTRIRRRFYDWDAQRRGLENETTPREAANLLLQIAREAAQARPGAAVARRAMSALLAQTDRETIPSALPNRPHIANKTGELPGVRNDVAIVGYGDPDAYVVAVLDRYGNRERRTAIDAIRGVVQTIDRRLSGTKGAPRSATMPRSWFRRCG